MLITEFTKHVLTFYGILSLALLLFALIVAGTNVYGSIKQFWLMVILSWVVAYVLGGVLYLFFKMDLIFTLMVASIVAYILMGDVLLRRKKVIQENFEKTEATPEKETAN